MFESVFKKPWPYWVGGIVLSLLGLLLLYTTGNPWKVGIGFIHLKSPTSVGNVAIVIGAMIASLVAGEFKWRKTKNKRQVGLALLGGVLMGFGARLGMGCNVSALFGGIPSMSLHGWVFGIFLFFGAWIGSKLLVKYLL